MEKLKLHVSSHFPNILPYNCSSCGESFKSESAGIAHKKTHTDEASLGLMNKPEQLDLVKENYKRLVPKASSTGRPKLKKRELNEPANDARDDPMLEVDQIPKLEPLNDEDMEFQDAD